MGLQDPHELIRYWSPIYVLCVSSHFWPFTKANLVLENFNKNLGFGQTPPPLVGPNAQLFPKMHFEGPPLTANEWFIIARISITGDDLQTLEGLNWLNDNIVNFYMAMLEVV